VISERTRLLVTTIQKLYHRGAFGNIQKILAKTHHADVSSVLQMLAEDEATEIFRLEKRPEQRAQILSYLESGFQERILAKVSATEASELVGNMESDDAADLLGRLSDDDSKTIIEGLASDESTEVVGLMSYPSDSAGGLMSSDFLSFPETGTVEQVIQALQDDESEKKVTFYVYVVNRTNHLVGVVSLKQLLLSRKSSTLRELMVTNIISVRTETDQEQVATTVARYDFLSVPVVDESNCLVGVITVDDVIDVIKQEAEEDLLSMAQAGRGVNKTWWEHVLARLPWLLATYMVGLCSFTLIRTLIGHEVFEGSHLWAKVCLMPLLLSVGAMAGNQVATVIMGATRTGDFLGGKLLVHLGREVLTGLMWGGFFGALTYALARFLLPLDPDPLALIVMLQIFFTVILGLVLPLAMDRMKMDALQLTPPIYASLADLGSLFILFGLFRG